MISVEHASGRAAKRRFVELPYMLFREEPRWVAPLSGVETARFDRFRNRRLMDLEHVWLLARRRGVPAGRLAVVVEDGVGMLDGFESIEDSNVAVALVAEAREWLRELDVDQMDGPQVLAEGFDVAGVTGRPWNPAWYVDGLTAAGLVRASERRTWRLPAVGSPSLAPTADAPVPEIAGRYGDRRLVLPSVAAVPDLGEAGGSTRELMRRAKRGEWSTAVITRCDGDPSVLVPALQAAAADAGYTDVIAPWSPDPDAPPETVHVRFAGRSVEGQTSGLG
jgi:hypothetical protein